MTDDDPGTDTPAQETCTFTADELHISEYYRMGFADWECSRPVWDETDLDRCVWHAERVDKPPDDLAATIRNGELVGGRARETDLTSVSFPQGLLLVGADLSDANLRGATLTDADLRVATLTNANLGGADLSDANLREATLTDANLRDATLTDADLRYAALTDADLGYATLTGATLWRADLANANLWEATLTDAYIHNTTLTDADLRRADLTDADLRDADLTDADLRDADLSGTDLDSASLQWANLEDATLTGSDLGGADVIDARLHRCRVQDVYISNETTFGTQCIYEREAGPSDIRPWRPPSTAAIENLQKAAGVYRTLQRLHRENSLPGRIGAYHYREREMDRRRAIVERRPLRWLFLALQRWVLGYGERPWRIVGTSLVAIGGFGLVYPFVGGMEATEKARSATNAFAFGEAFSLPLGTGAGRILFENLYFSAVTFTLSGGTGLRPVGDVAQLVASVESFLGAILMALFVGVLARQTMR